jgi:hypothetical protein
MPVGHVEDRSEDVAAYTVESERWSQERRVDEHRGEHDEQPGKEPPGATSPKRRQVDAAGAALVGAQPLAEQDPGNQQPREHEERVEGQDATRGEVPGVHRDREPNREATPTVERRPIGPTRSGRRPQRRLIDHGLPDLFERGSLCWNDRAWSAGLDRAISHTLRTVLVTAEPFSCDGLHAPMNLACRSSPAHPQPGR